MNQHARNFLLEAIEKQHKAEKQSLEDRKPKAPSLNNYLVTAILSGNFKLKTQAEIGDAISQRARDLGQDETLTESSSGGWRRRRGDDDLMLKIPALVIFEEPPDYTKARKEYEAASAKWQAEVDALQVAIDAMRIKVQIGSKADLETAFVSYLERMQPEPRYMKLFKAIVLDVWKDKQAATCRRQTRP